MLSVGPHARRSSPSQDIRVKTRLPRLVGNIHYRQRILSWLRIRLAGRPTRALQQDRILEPSMPQVDPLDLVETIREGLLVLEPDLTVQFECSLLYRLGS